MYVLVDVILLVDNPAWCYGISKYIFTWIHMLISCLRSERGSANLSSWVLLCGGMMSVE
jgi:hypothetical protein